MRVDGPFQRDAVCDVAYMAPDTFIQAQLGVHRRGGGRRQGISRHIRAKFVQPQAQPTSDESRMSGDEDAFSTPERQVASFISHGGFPL